MKNVKNLFGMAVMATALVGCSSNDNLNPNPNDNAGKAGTAYASFKINLPTVSGTRADGDPTFVKGDAKEYEVKNGTILIFDNSGKFIERAELGNMNPWTNEKDGTGVTTAAIATVQLHKVSVGGSYQALVLLNNNTETTNPKVKMPTSSSDTYASWSANAENADASEYVKTDGIFMANAPEYSATSDPKTLVPVAHVCASREQAEAMGATTVYVERGLAKVTMEKFTPGGYTISGGTYDGGKVEIKNWELDVTNKSTYPVHQVGDLSTTTWGAIWNTDRFHDTDAHSTFKRIYWGIDPNYANADYQNLANCKNAFNLITDNSKILGVAGQDNPKYCLENTFDLDNMKQGQTTRVVFKAIFTPKGLTFSGTDRTFYRIGNNTALWTAKTLSQHILTLALKAMKITTSDEQGKYSVDLNAGGQNSIAQKAGLHFISTDNIKFTDDTGTYHSKVDENVVNEINDKLGLVKDATSGKITTGISTYLNGEAYYIARIKHFNELTNWKPGDFTYSNPDLTKEENNKKYLGRYGVLRNNWYALSVTKISNLGYPEVPEVKPNIPDDENDQYINVEVKILDWAKRTQEIEL